MRGATRALSHKRGRPKADDRELLAAALGRWYKAGEYTDRALDWAIRETAGDPPRGWYRTPETLRRRLRRVLCGLDPTTRLLWAITGRPKLTIEAFEDLIIDALAERLAAAVAERCPDLFPFYK